jgi:hypothetical protein
MSPISRKIWAILAAIILIIAIIGVLWYFYAVPTAPPSENVIKLGASISLSGLFVKEGTQTKEGYELMVYYINEVLGGKR